MSVWQDNLSDDMTAEEALEHAITLADALETLLKQSTRQLEALLELRDMYFALLGEWTELRLKDKWTYEDIIVGQIERCEAVRGLIEKALEGIVANG